MSVELLVRPLEWREVEYACESCLKHYQMIVECLDNLPCFKLISDREDGRHPKGVSEASEAEGLDEPLPF